MSLEQTASTLTIEKLTVRRGNKVVVNDVSLEVRSGKLTTLLGPNGAGKSSLVLALAGALPIAGGIVLLDGKSIGGETPDAVRRNGIAVVPEGHQVLTALNVEDNLRAAGAMLTRHELQDSLAQAYALFPELAERKSQAAGTMSGGQQQMLALAQALIGRPKFLLVDEMSLGLAPIIVKRLMLVLKQLVQQGVGILLIEQFTQLALELADYACVMSRGTIRYSGDPNEMLLDARLLQQAYLGIEVEAGLGA